MIIAEDYLKLVNNIAASVRRCLPGHVEFCDLVDAGVIGLMAAIAKYDPNSTASFPTYASHRIRGAMLDEIRRFDFASRTTRTRYREIQAAKRSLTAELGRVPDETEVRLALAITPRTWAALMIEFRSLSQARIPGAEPPAVGLAADQQLAKQELSAHLADALKVLQPRTRRLLNLYYDDGLTMKQIAGILHVGESRISQIHAEALLELRSHLRARGISRNSLVF